MNKTDERIRKCQESLLELLDFFHKICIDNNIKYTLDCGTLIGAVREHGFIVWDDDADVSLIRAEYEKFKRALKKVKLPKNIGIYYPSEEKGFLDFNLRLYDKNIVVRDDADSKENYGGLFTHPTLDIYVYDKVPKNKFKCRFYILCLQVVWGFAMSKRHKVTIGKYKIIERVGIVLLGFVGKFISTKKVVELFDFVSKLYMNVDNDKCLLYGTSWVPEYPGYQYDISYYRDYVLTKFENKEFIISSNYDKILTIGYGDYMKPKKTHDHDNFIRDI